MPPDADRNAPSPPAVEQDSRFPSGKWVGFFLQPVIPGRHQMELILTFQNGNIRGEGRDWVGPFLISGRYDVEDGRCRWTKTYVGKHDIAYQGYNEGKGIWGTWSFHGSAQWKGGFYIWPEGMSDPTKPRIAEALDEPVPFTDEDWAEEADAVLVPVRTGRRERGREAEPDRR